MFLQSRSHQRSVCTRGGGGENRMTMRAVLKDVWVISDGGTLDLLRINAGHTNPTTSTNDSTDDVSCGGDCLKQQQAYFESVFAHRGDRNADWAGIYTQLTEEHSERYVPNRWDYTTTAELVRLNLRDTARLMAATEKGDNSIQLSCSSVTTNPNPHRTIVLLDLKPEQPSNEEEEEKAVEEALDVASDIKNHIAEKCPKTSWQRTTLTMPILSTTNSGGSTGGGGNCTTAGGNEEDSTTTTVIVPTPIWGIVAAHPSFQMSEPTLSSIEKARRLKRSIATTSTVPITIQQQHRNCCTSGGGSGVDIKASSSCTYEVVMELLASNKVTNSNGNDASKVVVGSSSSSQLVSLSDGRMLDDSGGTPLLGRLGELGAVVFVWDDDDSLECVIPHELLVRGNHDDITDGAASIEPNHGDTAYGARLFSCQSVRRYWRHKTLPITSRTEDVAGN